MKPSLGQEVVLVWPKHTLNGHRGKVVGIDDIFKNATVELPEGPTQVPYSRLKAAEVKQPVQRGLRDVRLGAE